jgi:hypothetical protein
MYNTKLHLNKQANTSGGRQNRASLLLVCGLMFSAQFFVGLVFSSLSFASQVQAQSILSWFTSDDEKQEDDLLKEDNQAPILVSQAPKQNAAFGELVYHYFQHDYQQVLQLIAVGNTKHRFTELSKDDTDRLNLMQGAAQLQLGMYKQSQAKFASLLSQTTSEYVQANTWIFMAKAGFENKQAYLSERAYEAILQGELRENLSPEQWHELLYLSAYTRMQLEQDWQSLQIQIPTENIYTAYLLANQGTLLFNKAEYEQAVTTFTQAKLALIEYKNRRGYITQIATEVFDSVSWAATPWRWFDDNAIAEQVIKERKEAQSLEEQNALFDRINIGLGQSLLQQGDLGNAIAVIQNIADGGAESEQALLTYGWANAKENRWQTAMSAWQHLQQNSIGLFSLQASYGLAYAFSRQDNLGQAFYALQTTSTQIDSNLLALDAFATAAMQKEFFTQYNEQWPQALDDLKLGFFAPSANFDAKYLLAMRLQADSVLADISDKQARVIQLDNLLKERQATYDQRLQGMSLSNALAQIEQTQQHIDDLDTLIVQSDTFEKQLALSKKMTSFDISEQLSRHDSANQRHARLAADTTRKRPLKASYKDRLDRLEGILTWQLMDNFIAQKWQHKQLLKQAQNTLTKTKQQYNNLQAISQNQDAFSLQRAQFSTLNQSLDTQVKAANNVYELATKTLTYQLISLIEARKAQLQEQGTNTRLAMLRIQDLQQQGDQ